MIRVDLRALTQPVGILRMVEVVFTCISFSLVASVGSVSSSYWAWCMFTWCFCCFFTLLILVLEFTTFNVKLPISWEDFTTAFAMLATLMMLAASIIYPSVVFSCPSCSRQIAASTVSIICVGVYVGEVVLLRMRPGLISGFLSSIPGLMKIMETFVACIIFTCLDSGRYNHFPGLQWCVAVYSLCFIFALLIILIIIGQLLAYFPLSFDKLVTVFNALAVLMYMTAAVIWPLYAFKSHPRPTDCTQGACLRWDGLVVVTFMTIINLIIYIMDTAYSIYLVFFIQHE
ncbi:myeloid-associated differentiation marker-like [Denticeps clupeoides]|uniref:MARVEL domain-containing protein n=1 Tax=Denticeps clupeoides TaxID=299321 RepID=A0AAY4AVC6_9TELE|nr:myeloid-associated differentiation marker-like [Denticeps clupeoides]